MIIRSQNKLGLFVSSIRSCIVLIWYQYRITSTNLSILWDEASTRTKLCLTVQLSVMIVHTLWCYEEGVLVSVL